MIYGAILAGGSGLRMGNTQKPKQFLMLGSKPIIIHTIEKFLCIPSFDAVYIGVLADWIPQCTDLLQRHHIRDERIRIVTGGNNRNETIMNIIRDIEKNRKVTEEDIIVTHDAVRPFVTDRIINDNIAAAQRWGACDTVIRCSDTIVSSDNGRFISSIPNRSEMYSGQTPQSFKISLLKEQYDSLTGEEKEILTDACKICVLKGQQVSLVEGDLYNFKITTQYDYKMAQSMLGGIADDK